MILIGINGRVGSCFIIYRGLPRKSSCIVEARDMYIDTATYIYRSLMKQTVQDLTYCQLEIRRYGHGFYFSTYW